jgi:hypothetical protein
MISIVNSNIAVINGKTYTLHRFYKHYSVGPFFVAVSGRAPLKPDDVDQHWIVKRSGHTYIAFALRYFSYHLLAGEHSVMPPSKRWKLKTTTHYAFVAPTQAALEQHLHLVVEQYRLKKSVEDLLSDAMRVDDAAGQGPQALLIRASDF